MQALVIRLKHWPARQPLFFLLLASALWFVLYQALVPAADALVAALPVARDSHLGGALQFFFYDTPKVLLLLTGIVFVMGIIHTFVSPERTRAMLAGRRLGVGNMMAATQGIVTPFCSCSAMPLSLSAFCRLGGAGRDLLLFDLGADGQQGALDKAAPCLNHC